MLADHSDQVKFASGTGSVSAGIGSGADRDALQRTGPSEVARGGSRSDVGNRIGRLSVS
jgi:hypothetical protein